MKEKLITLLILFFVLAGVSYPGKDKIKYYRLDKIISVSGKVTKIMMENSYTGNRFIIFELKETKSKKLFYIEVSPKWFFELDIGVGSVLDVKGSLNTMKKKNLILTQSMIFEGEVYNFRDKLGFPLWRGKSHAPVKNKWKGEMRRKGKR